MTIDDAHLLAHITGDLPVGVWVARAPGGELLYANKEFTEIMGMTARDDVAVGEYAGPYGICDKAGAPYPEERMPFVRALRERVVVTVDDIVIHRRDRTKVSIRAQARPIFDEAGAITHVVIAFIDISREALAEEARAETEARLLRAQKMESIGRLAGGIAHDFNNLLSVVLGNISVAGLELPEAHAARAALEDATLAVRKAAELTNQLLAYAGRASRDVRSVDLSGQVQEIVALLGTSLAKEVSLELDLASDLPSMEADATQVQQVVMNLVLNAAEAIGGREGAVRVATATTEIDAARAKTLMVPGELTPGRFVVLTVKDSGCGMDAAARARIFDPFFSTKLTGRGLGLATVLGIIKGHRGAIDVTSAPGQGTTFRVYFPASERAVVRRSHAPRDARRRGRGGLVLIVDDEAAVRVAFRRLLEAQGYRVIEAATGEEGIALFSARAAEIRAVLLDMTMPGMSGDEALLELRKVRAEVPVVIISGHSETDVRRKLDGERAVAFLPKPFTGPELERTLADAIGE